jgi:tellurite resistance protein TehA-like permease
MTAVAITLYNLSCLLLRHHHAMLHNLHHAAGALVLLAGFYTMIRYMQSLPDDEG